MADFLWIFAVQEALKKTVKLAAKQIGLAWGFEEELSKLRESLLMAQAILRDVDRTKADLESLKLWVKKLEDIVFEADDLLDELAYEDDRCKVETRKVRMVRNLFSFSKNSVAFRLIMANKITAVTKKLNEHYSTKSPVGSGAITAKEAETDLRQIRETDSFPDKIKFIGRKTEVSNIVNDLLACRSQEPPIVLSIVGIGGLGKTALAKEVFHHEMIRKNFDTHIWVCVSDLFDIMKILRVILKTFDPMCGGLDSKEVILQQLQKWLSNKKYFLVLDDVWNEKPNLWDELEVCLLKVNQNSGSAIVVTTRSNKVAKIMKTAYTHHLRRLSNDHCWSLFLKSFRNEVPTISDEIQGELVNKFGGIPLVAIVLGRMVKSCKNDKELQSTLENLRGIALQDESYILSIIKLSVEHLPSSSLKQCFAYCSNFPPDFDFNEEELILMWVAQGFIQLDNESNLLEETGAHYFDILLSRSFFQDVYKDGRGKIISCKMHDLIYEVACSISNYRSLRLDLVTNEKFLVDEALSISERRRTVYWSKNVHFDNLGKITNFIFLRVLIIDSWSICELPDKIHKLKLLRYLDISHTSITKLPKSIEMLYMLQTLKLGDSFCKEVPTIRKLISLKHLIFDYGCQTFPMLKHLGQLTQLQTLRSFVVGSEEGCKIEELGPLKDLKGELSILFLERVKSKEEVMAANLKEKKNISELCFKWVNKGEGLDENDLNVLEGLQPHKNLKVLIIDSFGGEHLPNGIFVENLVELYLSHCHRCETLPMLGQLSKLTVIQIYSLENIRSIGDEFYGNYRQTRTLFPKLEDFSIRDMKSLEHWEEIDTLSNCTTFPHLKELSIYYCSKLTNIPNIILTRCERLDVGTYKSSFQDHPKFRSLHIFDCQNITKQLMLFELYSSLKELELDNGRGTYPLNLQHFQNLSSLIITNCQEMPEGLACIRNLKKLVVEGPRYERGINPLREFPQQLKHLTALRFLHIENFYGIESLPEWLGNLTSLETLELKRCRNLKSLPSKEAMSNLIGLKNLTVDYCSKLDLSEGGSERAKVSHVPNVRVS